MKNEKLLKDSITQASDWESAVDAYIKCTLALGQPFTSGHITTILRVYRPELRVKHEWVGERCQNHFYGGDLLSEDGNLWCQVPRICAGLGRTPSGTTVFVYASEYNEALAFPFEIDIPSPGSNLLQMPSEHPILAMPPAPSLPSGESMEATVHADLRLCIPRAALEALLHSTGKSLKATDPVWVRFENNGDTAVVSLDSRGDAKMYQLQATRGRILFTKTVGTPWVHGEVFKLAIQGGELVADLSKSL